MNEEPVLLREELLRLVRTILDSERDGSLTLTQELQSVDFKEEAGRRQGKELLPGEPHNPKAAKKLSNAAACMANSPGGGALIVGVEDKTGRVLGTELDTGWLRQRIFQAIGVTPDIQAHSVAGLRVLVIIVPESKEPVPDTRDRLRWRVGDSCQPVERAEWWARRSFSSDIDPMLKPTALGVADVRAPALTLCRKWRGKKSTALTDEELLRVIGAINEEGKLTAAAAKLLTPLGQVVLELTQFPARGSEAENRLAPSPEWSLAEQIDFVEKALRGMNTAVPLEAGPSHRKIPRIPNLAIKEAILNGVIHRDWNREAATQLRWYNRESTFEVRSPGGFVGEVTKDNVLSHRESRYPALADLLRAVGLVDKQGVGVDRMYQSMIALGHRPPLIEELPGPSTEITLTGGPPKAPVMALFGSIRPEERQQDYRLAILIYLLLNHPFVTEESLAKALQSSIGSAHFALTVAEQSAIQGEPIIKRYRDVWVFGTTAIKIIQGHPHPLAATTLLPYRGTTDGALRTVLTSWLAHNGEVKTGDIMALSGVSRGTAKKFLEGLASSNELTLMGGGRSSRYVASENDKHSGAQPQDGH